MSGSEKPEITNSEIFKFLRKIANSFEQDFTNAWSDIEKAKFEAAKLYVSHTNREINLNQDEFKLIISILEFK